MSKASGSSLDWLEISNWYKVTREERHFCAHLYECIRQNPSVFIELLNKRNLLKNCTTKQTSLSLNPCAYVDAGFEVAFYRDLEKKKIKIPSSASIRRKFDLALFFKDQLVIIEAKAQQRFDKKRDLEKLSCDHAYMKELFPDIPTVFVGISSSKWFYSKRKEICVESHFNGFLTWGVLAEEFPAHKHVFQRANCVYGK